MGTIYLVACPLASSTVSFVSINPSRLPHVHGPVDPRVRHPRLPLLHGPHRRPQLLLHGASTHCALAGSVCFYCHVCVCKRMDCPQLLPHDASTSCMWIWHVGMAGAPCHGCGSSLLPRLAQLHANAWQRAAATLPLANSLWLRVPPIRHRQRLCRRGRHAGQLNFGPSLFDAKLFSLTRQHPAPHPCRFSTTACGTSPAGRPSVTAL